MTRTSAGYEPHSTPENPTPRGSYLMETERAEGRDASAYVMVAEAGLDAEKWAKVAPFWWISDRLPYQDFEWRRWTWHVGEPPQTPQMRSGYGHGWRHPTYAEAVERQQRFEEATRAEWDDWMNFGSYTNLARLAPHRGYERGLPGRLILDRWRHV